MPPKQPKKKLSVGNALTHLGAKVLLNANVKEDTMPGETHGILKMPNGSYERAAYMGPGTQVIKRLQKGIKGKTAVDRIAKRHDIDYGLATSPADVKRADKKMVKSLRALKKGEDSQFNIMQGKLMIPKMLAEKITGRTYFNDMKGPRTPQEKEIYTRAKMEMIKRNPVYGY